MDSTGQWVGVEGRVGDVSGLPFGHTVSPLTVPSSSGFSLDQVDGTKYHLSWFVSLQFAEPGPVCRVRYPYFSTYRVSGTGTSYECQVTFFCQ